MDQICPKSLDLIGFGLIWWPFNDIDFKVFVLPLDCIIDDTIIVTELQGPVIIRKKVIIVPPIMQSSG